MRRIHLCIGRLSLVVACLAVSAATVRAANYTLGTTFRVEGPNGGPDSIAMGVTSPTNGAWTASSSAPWIHILPGSASGIGSTNVYFSCDTNTGPTRTNSFTIQGMTVTVVQAPTNYVAALMVSNLVVLNSYPRFVAVDKKTGNLFISDQYDVWKWTASNGNLAVVAIPDVNGSSGLAVSNNGDLYIADSGSNQIKVLPAGGTLGTPLKVVTNATGLNYPSGVAFDPAGNLYIADSDNFAIKELPVGATSPHVVATTGFVPYGLGVDSAGDVYAPGYYEPAEVFEAPAGLNEWDLEVGPYYDTPYDPAGFWAPLDASGDGSGNVFVADELGGLWEWVPATQTLIAAIGDVVSESIDFATNGYLYNANYLDQYIGYLPYAYLDPVGRNFPQRGDAGVIPPVVPATVNLTGPYAPTTDAASWLTLTVNSDDSITYQAGFNNGPPLVGHIFLLGWTITITQDGDTYTLGESNVFEPATAGQDSVDLAVGPSAGVWSNTANASWLHFNAANETGAGSATIQFSFDANAGPTRTGTLTIENQTLTITQVGDGYTAADEAGALSLGLVTPYGVAVDSSGDVFIADPGSKTIKEWVAATDTTVTVVSTGLTDPTGIAVDSSGDLFIADGTGNSVYEVPSGGSLTPLITTGLHDPTGLAVDSYGDLFIADSGDNTIYELPVGGSLTVVLATGLNDPTGIAVDDADDIFIADSGDNKIFEYNLDGTLTPLVTSGLHDPTGVAVNGAGDVFIADTGDNAIYELPYGGTLTYIAEDPNGVAVDDDGNVYFTDGGTDSADEYETAYVEAAPIFVGANAGSGSLPPVLPTTTDLTGAFAPNTDQSWLSISGVSNGVVNFSYAVNTGALRTGHILVLGTEIEVTQSGATFATGWTNRLEGPAAGIDGVVLAVAPSVSPWTASANASWLHLSASNQGGVGPTNVVFSFDANGGATRCGTLTVAGQTLMVTQAGSAYVPTGSNGLTTLVSDTPSPTGVGVDPSGDVYYSQFNALLEWKINNTVSFLYINSEDVDLNGLAVDRSSNVYFALPGLSAVDVYMPENQSSYQVTSGSGANNVAVDGAGNLYFSAPGNGAIFMWTAGTQTLSQIVGGLNHASGVAVDAAGNVYYADSGTSEVYEWNAVNHQITTLASFPQVNQPDGLAVDGAGNLFIANTGWNRLDMWDAASNTFTTLVTGLNGPQAVAVDGAGNLYIANTGDNAIQELPNAYVNPAGKLEPNTAGSDSLPAVLPTNANLTGPFGPISSQSWLTITGVTNGVIRFSFAANAGDASLQASINVLGQSIPVTQNGPYSLSAYSRLESPFGGNDSVILVVGPGFPSWTTSPNADWLHVSQSGAGSANIVFSVDYNSGDTRTGAITIAGETLTVTQAGAQFTQVSLLGTLVSAGLNNPQGVAVDAAGDLFIADAYNSAIEELPFGAPAYFTLVSSSMGLGTPTGVAVDAMGNLYIADTGSASIDELPAGANYLTQLVTPNNGLEQVQGVAVDVNGNLYITDPGGEALEEWSPTTQTLTPLILGLDYPDGVAVDAAGNVYVGNTYDYDVLEWNSATSSASELAQVYVPFGVAVDVAGNVYVADPYEYTIDEWTPADPYFSGLVSSGLSFPEGVAVDSCGNVYIADTDNNAVEEYPYAFVDTTPKSESPAAGTDSITVLPATANLSGPFAPTSDSPWLTVNSTAGGVITIGFTANTEGARMGNIYVMGEDISVCQSGTGINPPTLNPPMMVSPGVFEFTFTSVPGGAFTILSTTDLTLPLSQWTVVGSPEEVSPGQYQFTASTTTGANQVFYTVRSP